MREKYKFRARLLNRHSVEHNPLMDTVQAEIRVRFCFKCLYVLITKKGFHSLWELFTNVRRFGMEPALTSVNYEMG